MLLKLLFVVIKLMVAVGTATTGGTTVMMVMLVIVVQIVRIFHDSFGCLCEDFVPHQRFGMQH